jgi:DNA-binding CsgD family transcriptional regulator
MGVLEFTRARDRLLAFDPEEQSPGEVCAAISAAVQEVAPFVACAVMTTDPETMLPSGGLVEGFDPSYCVPFWDNELLDPDFNKFTDLARRHEPIASLADTVEGDLHRSPRFQKLYAPFGATDELRATFMAGTSCLAVGVFLRGDGEFTTEEVADVRALLPVATSVLRHSLGRIVCEGVAQPPVVIMLDGDGEITGMSAGGQKVLDDLRVNVDGDFPGIVQVAATKARWSRTATNLTTRLQGRSGRWLRLSVSPMEGEVGAVAVTVENARPDDLARVLLESYGLTRRETEIVLLLCRGCSTKEIAAELVISAHTVRDHVKSVYEKAGVNSRGELVAGLFSNHVLGRFHDTVMHLG